MADRLSLRARHLLQHVRRGRLGSGGGIVEFALQRAALERALLAWHVRALPPPHVTAQCSSARSSS